MTFPILISIRNTSSRLPGKCFVEIAGRPAVHRLVQRLLGARGASGVVITTSSEQVDDGLEAAARTLGVRCVRGAAEDKLLRYAQAAEELEAEFVVIVDGDDVLADPAQIDRIISSYRQSAEDGMPLDYVIVDELPTGATGFGVRVAALQRVLDLRNESDREVWGAYFTATGLFNVRRLQPDEERLRRADIRLTLDYPEDLELLRSVLEHFDDESFGLGDVIAFLDEHPAIAAVNREAQQRYEANLASKARPVKLG